MPVLTGKKLGDELVKLWGWKNCRSITIRIVHNEVATITAEFNATEEQGKDLIIVLKKYELKAIDE